MLKTGLRLKFLLFFLLILVVPFSLLMLISVRRAEDAARQDFSRRLATAGSLFRETLVDLMNSLRIKAKTVADFDFYAAAKDGFTASTTLPLMQDRLLRSGIDYLALVSEKTKVLLDEGSPPAASLQTILPAVCHSPLTSNLFILNQEPWIFAGAEITKLRNQEKYHVVFAVRLPRDFADKIKRITGAEYSLIYSGQRILTTLMDIYGKRMIEALTPLPDVDHGETQVLGKVHSFVREEVLPGEISETILLEISLPESDFTKLGRGLQGDVLFFGGIGILLALTTGSLLYMHVGTPLVRLTEVTTQVAGGNFAIDLSSDRNDEIGLLHRNFTAMVRSIRDERDQKMRRMEELNTLFEISNAVNFITDSEELLKFVLTHAVEILGSERGSIMLLDDETDELVVKVAYGGRYRVTSSTPVKLGNGICGLVAKEGKARICNTGFKDLQFKNFGSLLPVEDIKTLLCSPLKFKEGTIGVINVVNKRDGKDFAESDLSLLNLIASQAAVTIENNKLYELSITDGLTRLFVHRYFHARISEEVLRARRYGLKLSLVMIDIDDFKNFNDVYGHQVGDQVLQRVAMTIKENIRMGIDIPCRYGGEEMSVILPETRAEEAFKTADRIRESIAALATSHPLGNLRITVSIGVAGYPSDAHDRDSLIMAADKALYSSKLNGKNCTTESSQSADSKVQS